MESSLLAQHVNAGNCRCPRCGYALRGLVADRCPECGVQLLLTISTPGTRSGQVSAVFILWWCLAFHAAAILTSVWSTWSIYGVLRLPMSAFPRFFWSVFMEDPVTDVTSAALAAATAFWLAIHRRVFTASNAARWTPRVSVAILLLTLLLPLLTEFAIA